jgi:hypothetical protein
MNTYTHAVGDPPDRCWACEDDADPSSDKPIHEGVSSVAETRDGEPICWCGHVLVEQPA